MHNQFASHQSQKLILNWLLSYASAFRSKDSSRLGFTMTEVLIVVIIAAALAAIAAPSWLAFSNRQRVSAANTELLQMLREAQTEAISKRTTYGVELDANAAFGPTVTKFTAKGQGASGNIVPIYTEKLGDGDINKNSGLTLTTIPPNVDQYRFNFDGSVDGMAAPGNDYIYKLVVEKDGVRRCIIMETLLGALVEGQGAECDA